MPAATEAPVAVVEVEAPPPLAGTAVAQTAPQGSGPQAAGRQRLIIKNAQINLLVVDTDIAIDRTTQVVGDLGGYIISSRAWYQPVGEKNYKYATITIGVPVDRFEDGLRRLRELAIRVLDENATGEDVTDEYVDLESRLRNLEATRDRIREFLKQANTVDEALRVNQQLSEVEDQIEQVKGRMNYLFDRAAFSTITIQIEPDINEPTPTLTPTPTPWSPGGTVQQAGSALGNAFRYFVEAAIWILVLVVPILAPPALVIWGIWRLTHRKKA